MSVIEETAKNLRREHMDTLSAPWLRTLRLAHDDAITLVNMRHAGLNTGRKALRRAGIMSEWRHGYAHAMLRVAMVDWQAAATKLWAEESVGRIDAVTSRLLAKGKEGVAILRAKAGAKYRAKRSASGSAKSSAESSAESSAAVAPRRQPLERERVFMSTAIGAGERALAEQRG